LRGKAPDYTHLSENTVLTWLSGKYLKVDGIFVEVVSQRGHVWHVKKLNSDKIFYLATDGNGKYSHGDTLKDAKDSLIYKIINRDKSRYEKLTINSVLSLSEMIECYRVITGACEFGVKDFIKTTCNNKPKKEYSIKEIIKITQNAFGGNTFDNFFKNGN
jgi:16S rRNA U1498 N3-methylase RsmE